VNRQPVYKLFGKNPRLDVTSFVAPNAAIVGDVHLAPGVSVWYGAVLRADCNKIKIGEGSSIGDNTVVHVASKYSLSGVPNPTLIGQSVVVGE
jgi:gamma-carbonic anhydrase